MRRRRGSKTCRRRRRMRMPRLLVVIAVVVWLVGAAFLLIVVETTEAYTAALFLSARKTARRRAFVATCRRYTMSNRDDTLSPSSMDRLEPNDFRQASSSSDGDASTETTHIPPSGISVSDEMEAAQKERFVTAVVPIKSLPAGVVAQLVTTPVLATGTFEPVRYLVALSPPQPQPQPQPPSNNATINTTSSTSSRSSTDFVMVDIPPYSPQLATQIKTYLNRYSGNLVAILLTNRDSIHYDDAPAIFSMRRADLGQWAKAFDVVVDSSTTVSSSSSSSIVAYRLDIPRDCRYAVTQVLDGYGPWHYDNENNTFVESGRPLTYSEWDYAVAQQVMSGATVPPDDSMTAAALVDDHDDDDDDANYTPQAIRQRQDRKQILAVFTPGHSFGSVSYVFPETRVCCSGFTLPVEDSRYDDDDDDDEAYGSSLPGPALDCRGYITTSRAGIRQQMQSARELVQTYVDRFEVVLPARGDPMFLDGNSVEDRKQILFDILDQFKRIGEVYEQLGITADVDDDTDE